MANTSILLGTNNPAKERRLRWLLEGLPIDAVTPVGAGLAGEGPEEGASSHEEVACLKAQDWSRASGMRAIASDGGLVIPALGSSWESLHTHRFAGRHADDTARLEFLLQLMRPFKGEERRASWVEALAIAENGRTLGSWQVEGATGLLLEGSGEGPVVPGFWVFSVWHFPHLGKTYNQLNDEELERLNDHWSQLKSSVQRFFHEVVGTSS